MHGGFETFAEQLSLYLVSHGHSVTVYCQINPGESEFTDVWRGVRRVAFAEKDTAFGTIKFDLRSALVASRHRDACILTLGYNTAIFSIIYWLKGIRNLMNMDGIEWKRRKWNFVQRVWLWANEWCGAHLSNHLIADHPEIKNHLAHIAPAEKITVIPYGADPITQADPEIVRRFSLEPGKYFLVVARPEPENSLLEIVKAYALKPREFPLVILGKYLPKENPYHAAVIEAAGNSTVLFLGALYDLPTVQMLRYYAAAYLHGHQVGGTNPSLIESLAAGSAIIANDNIFNRWVAGPGARYFSSVQQLADHFDQVQQNPADLEEMRSASRQRHLQFFTREAILQAYEQLLQGLPLNNDAWQGSRLQLLPRA